MNWHLFKKTNDLAKIEQWDWTHPCSSSVAQTPAQDPGFKNHATFHLLKMKKRTKCVTFLLVIFTWPSGLMKQQGFIVHLPCAELNCGIGWQRSLRHSLCPQGINRGGSWNWKSHGHRLVCCPLNVPEPHQFPMSPHFSSLAHCLVYGCQSSCTQLCPPLAHLLGTCKTIWFSQSPESPHWFHT